MIDEWLDSLGPEDRGAVTVGDVPEWVDPMLATLVDEAFSDPDWIYERKLDGQRVLAFRDGDDVRLLSRNRESAATAFPEIVEALAAVDLERFVIDGEVVAFEGDVTSFQRLQGRIHVADPDEARATGIGVYLYCFDVLHADGHDVGDVPLRDRKRLLRSMFDWDDPIRFTPHRNAEGEAYLEEACDRGWEGLIAKDATAPYVHARSRRWQKFKCVHRQELVVGGFTDPRGERIGFGALLVGHHRDGELVYAGKVGTGFDDETLAHLGARLADLEVDASPFDAGEPPDDAHWIRPELVAEIGFTEWTEAGRLRHPRFLGLRTDKDPADVVRERPA